MAIGAKDLAFCFLVLATLAGVPAQADDGKLFPAEAAIPNSRVIRFTSAIDGEPYTLQISIPLFPSPKTGYPVIYVLDGELYFPAAAILSDLLGSGGAVVVGIGHDAFNDKAVIAHYASRKPGQPLSLDGAAALSAFNNLRNHDFRWPAKPEHRAPVFLETILGPETGDLDAFLSVIEKEIKPRVEALVSIDKTNQALFGHSAGGLAVVHALFTEPTAFRSFIAVSPALWYDGGAVLTDEKQFAAAVTKGFAAPRVLIAAAAQEPDTPGPSEEFIASLPPAQRAEIAPYAKMLGTWPGMISGSRELAAGLTALPGKPGYTVEYALIADEDHTAGPFAAVAHTMRFAFLGK